MTIQDHEGQEAINPFLEDDDVPNPFLDEDEDDVDPFASLNIKPYISQNFPKDTPVAVAEKVEPAIEASAVALAWEEAKSSKPAKSSKALLPAEHDKQLAALKRRKVAAANRKRATQAQRDLTVEKAETEGSSNKEANVLIGSDGRELRSATETKDFESRKANHAAFRRRLPKASGITFDYYRKNGRMSPEELATVSERQLLLKTAQTLDGSNVSSTSPLETDNERMARVEALNSPINVNSKGRASIPRFGTRELEVLKFIARFRYAKVLDFARMFGTKEETEQARLEKLREMGFVADRQTYNSKPLWLLTTQGIAQAGYDLVKTTEATITPSMFNHQFVTNHVAANVIGGKTDVLQLSDWPLRNRTSQGQKVWGEEVVSELQIQSSLGKLKQSGNAAEYRPGLLRELDRAFDQWKITGGSSPESLEGNEWMLTLFPHQLLKLAWHVPDLVVLRDRSEDGSPQSIAVEVELNKKPDESYRKTLETYKYDSRIYGKVVWVSHKRSIRDAVERIAKDVGLWKTGRISIVSVISEAGEFTGKDLWNV